MVDFVETLMINIHNEELLTLSGAAKRLPHGRAGKPVHVATIHRWASPGGLQGVRLETIKIGGVRYTSAEALERFIAKCSADDARQEPQSTRQRQRAIATAAAELERAGI